MKRRRYPKRRWPIQKICEICKHKFLLYPPNAKGKYCSKECKRLAGNKSAAMWRNKHPEQVKKTAKIQNMRTSLKNYQRKLVKTQSKISSLKVLLDKNNL